MSMTRRNMIGWTASFGGGLLLTPRLVRAVSANEIVHHAAIGASGMGWPDIHNLTRHPKLKLIAVCDVDEGRFTRAANAHPHARRYMDWRDLLDREQKNIDSINITIPDHMHASVTMAAMQLGKHVYCQKPMAKWLHETRKLTEYAAEHPQIVTQLGIQHHSSTRFRIAVQILRDGVLGRIKRVHAWSNKKWGGGSGRPKPKKAPKELDWNLWLGVAPQRPYADGYHPGTWRNWVDFGCGLLGDMAAHIIDTPLGGLKLGPPLRVRSEGPAPSDENWPAAAVVHYDFAPTEYTHDDELRLTWYDGQTLPPSDVTDRLPEGNRLPQSGAMMIGENGAMLLPHAGTPRLLPRERFAGEYEYPRVESDDHYRQYVDAVLGNRKVRAPFAYGGPLTEAILIGTVAQRLPDETLVWDAANCRFEHEQANAFLSRPYREGWSNKSLGL